MPPPPLWLRSLAISLTIFLFHATRRGPATYATDRPNPMASQFPPKSNLPVHIDGPDGKLPACFSQEVLRITAATTVDDEKMTDAERHDRWAAAQEALMSFVPSEPVEAMYAAQAVAAHTAAMECLRKAMEHWQSETTRIRLRSNATSLMRSFNAIMRALERHRGWAAGKEHFIG